MCLLKVWFLRMFPPGIARADGITRILRTFLGNSSLPESSTVVVFCLPHSWAVVVSYSVWLNSNFHLHPPCMVPMESPVVVLVFRRLGILSVFSWRSLDQCFWGRTLLEYMCVKLAGEHLL